MRIDVLGPLQAAGTDGPVTIPGRRSAAALCWLVVNANHAVSLDSLVGVLWSVPPASAAAKARMLVRSLAVLFPAGTLEVDGRLRLIVPDDAIDAWRFERLIREAGAHLRTDDRARAQANLDAALQLWRADPFPELDRAPAAMGAIDRLIEMRLQAIENRNALALRGRVDYTLIAELRALVILHPDRPRLHRQLALALYRTDRQIEALDVLHAVRREIGDDDGRSAQLETAILQHAAELAEGELRGA